jgi:hypothetical protein
VVGLDREGIGGVGSIPTRWRTMDTRTIAIAALVAVIAIVVIVFVI